MKRFTAKDAKEISSEVDRKKHKARERANEISREVDRKKHKARELAAHQLTKLKNIFRKLIQAAISGRSYCYHKLLEEDLCKRLVARNIRIKKIVSVNVVGGALFKIYASSLTEFNSLSAKISALQITYGSKRHKVLYESKKYQKRESYQHRLLELEDRFKEKLIELEARRNKLLREIDAESVIGQRSKDLLEISWGDAEIDAEYLGEEWKFDARPLRLLSGDAVQKLLSKIENFVRQEAEAGKRQATLHMKLESGYWWCLMLGGDKFYTSLTDRPGKLYTSLTCRQQLQLGFSPSDVEKLLAYLGYKVRRDNYTLHLVWA
jgi:hypothetical protein